MNLLRELRLYFYRQLVSLEWNKILNLAFSFKTSVVLENLKVWSQETTKSRLQHTKNKIRSSTIIENKHSTVFHFLLGPQFFSSFIHNITCSLSFSILQKNKLKIYHNS